MLTTKHHNHFYFITRIITFLLIFYSFSSNSLALPNDQNKVAYINADQAMLNRKIGINIFTGHVKFDQGTTHVSANKIVTYSNKQRKVTKMIAYGDPHHLAHYQTVPKLHQKPLDAWAVVIKYFPKQRVAYLIKDAVAIQKPNTFKGPIIRYDMTNQVVQSYAQKAHHTTIILHPDQIPK